MIITSFSQPVADITLEVNTQLVPKNPNLHKNELNTTLFCSKGPLKAPNRLKSLKLAWRFVLTIGDIYQNPFI
jgi:hypothetical protein